MLSEIKFREYYFSSGLRWTVLIGSVVISFYLLFWTKSQWLIAMFVVIILVLFSMRYEVIIDINRKEIQDLFFVLFIRKGKTLKYTKLDFISIEKERVTYNASSRSRDRVVDYNNFTAKLIYDESKSLDIASRSDYKYLRDDMERFSRELGIPIKRTL